MMGESYFVDRLRTALSGYLNVSKKAAGSLILKITKVGLGLTGTVLLARFLTPSQYGIYTWVMALVTMVAMPLKRGIGQLLIREVSRYRSESRWDLLNGIIRWSDGAVLGLVLIVAATLAGVSLVSPDFLGGPRGTVIIAAFFLLPFYILGELRGATLRGMQRVIVGQLPDALLRPGFLAIVLVAAVVLGPVNAVDAMLIHAGAAGIAFAAIAVVHRKAIRSRFEREQGDREYQLKDWCVSVIPLAFVGGMQFINNQADVVLLGIFRPSEEVGIYRISARASGVIVFMLFAVNRVIAPQIAGLYSEGRLQELQELLTFAARLVLVAGLPIAAVLALWGNGILSVIFGEAYSAAYEPLLILSVGQIVSLLAGSVALLLNMTGHERATASGIATAAVANVGLNLLLIPFFGMIGAAIATTASMLVWNGILCWVAYDQTGLMTTAIQWRHYDS